MMAEQMLRTLVTLQDDARMATFERNRLNRLRAAGFDDRMAARRNESRAVNKRDAFVDAIANHLNTRCHNVFECPICKEDRR